MHNNRLYKIPGIDDKNIITGKRQIKIPAESKNFVEENMPSSTKRGKNVTDVDTPEFKFKNSQRANSSSSFAAY